MAEKVYQSKHTGLAVPFGTVTVTDIPARTHTEPEKTLQFVGGFFTTSDEDEQALLESLPDITDVTPEEEGSSSGSSSEASSSSEAGSSSEST